MQMKSNGSRDLGDGGFVQFVVVVEVCFGCDCNAAVSHQPADRIDVGPNGFLNLTKCMTETVWGDMGEIVLFYCVLQILF